MTIGTCGLNWNCFRFEADPMTANDVTIEFVNDLYYITDTSSLIVSGNGHCTSVNDPGSTSPDHEYVCSSSPGPLALDFYFYLSDQDDTITFKYGATSTNVVYGGGGDDTITFESLGPFPNVRVGIAHGGAGNDTINGWASYDYMYGGPGNDLLTGLGNRDWLYGQGGRDRLLGGGAHDALEGNAGADRLDGGDGGDDITGGARSDKLLGRSGFDSLNGSSGIDVCRVGPDGGTKKHCE